MELMRGGSVADVLRKEDRIEHQRALRWLREAASGLDAAHAAGIVHRDVKPANLLLDDRDRLGIGDFGIARLAWEEQVTQTGQVLGTAAYISPEQAMGEPATAASDRYALAVVAFELLTGEKPFQAEHFAAQARAHIEDDPPRVSELAPELSERVDDVIDRGMAKDPDDRWGSAEEFVERLDASMVPPRRPRPPPRAGPPRRASSPTRERTPPPPSRPARPAAAAAAGAPRRSSGPGTGMLLAGVVAALLIVVLGFLLLKGNGDDPGNQASSTAARRRRRRRPRRRRRRRRRRTKTQTPEPTPTATATPTDDARAPRRQEAEGQPERAPAAGLQPQQRRQVRRGAAARPGGGPQGLQGQRGRQPVRLRALRPRSRPARDRRRGGRGQVARGAPRSATPTTSAPRSRPCSTRPSSKPVSRSLRTRAPKASV